MAKRNWSESGKEKIIRRRRRKADEDKTPHTSTRAEQTHADVHLLQRTLGNSALEQILNRPKSPPSSKPGSLQEDIQHITNRAPGKRNDAHQHAPIKTVSSQRVVQRVRLPWSRSRVKPASNFQAEPRRITVAPAHPDNDPQQVLDAYKTSGIMVRKLYSWQKEMPFFDESG